MIFSEQQRQIPRLQQRQDSAFDQLQDLVVVANRLGMYDAADFIRMQLEKMTPNKTETPKKSINVIATVAY